MSYTPLANYRSAARPRAAREPEPLLAFARQYSTAKTRRNCHRALSVLEPVADHTLLSQREHGLIRLRLRFRSRPAIFDAIYAFDAEALRRELAAGVDPNVSYDGSTPLYSLVLFRAAGRPAERIQERLECISVLLEAGASVDFCPSYPWEPIGRTALHRIAHNRSRAYTAVIAALIEGGADVNFTDVHGNSVLVKAAASAPAATVKCLISAGAADLDGALRAAIENGKHRNCAPLLRAGAARPARYTAPGQVTSPLVTRKRALT